MSTKRRNLNKTHSNQNTEYKIGDYVLLKNREGFIRYIGKRKHNHGIWYGIELINGIGPTDGSEHGERYIPDGSEHGEKYFCCKIGRGIFVRIYAIKTKIFPPPTDRRLKYKPTKTKLKQPTLSERTHQTTLKTKTNIYNSIKTSENETIQSTNYQTLNKLKIKNTVSNKTINTSINNPSFRNTKNEYRMNNSMSGGISRMKKKNYEIMKKETQLSNMDCNSKIKTLHTIYDEKNTTPNTRAPKPESSISKSRGGYVNDYCMDTILALPEIKDVNINSIHEVKLDNNESDSNKLTFGYDLNEICEHKMDNIFDIKPIHSLALADITSEDLNNQIEQEYRHSLTFTGLKILDMSSISSCESLDIKELEFDKNEQLNNLRNRFNSVNGIINNMLTTMITHDNVDDFKIDIRNMNGKKEENNNDENDINHEVLTLNSITTETSAKSESFASLSLKGQISAASEIESEITIKLRASESEQSSRSECKRNNNEDYQDMIGNILATIDIEMNININTKQSVTINSPISEDDCENICNILSELDELDNNEIKEEEKEKLKMNTMMLNKNKSVNENENMFYKMLNKFPLILTKTQPEVIHHWIPPSYEEANLRYKIKSQKEIRDKKLKNKKNKNNNNNNELEEIVCVSLWDRIATAMKL